MNLNEQVCALAQAKRLKELGVLDIGEFHYREYLHKKTNEYDSGITYGGVGEWKDARSWNYGERYSAFTVAELGEMIGKGTKAAEIHWQWLLDCVNSGLSGTVCYNAVALAGHIITQLETGTLTPQEVNNRLNQ